VTVSIDEIVPHLRHKRYAAPRRHLIQDPMPTRHTISTRLVSVVASLLLLASIVAATSPVTALTPEEYVFIELINQERANEGLYPLTVYWDLTDVARVWSDTMQTD
jgi:uncharacterized protein YkwD